MTPRVTNKDSAASTAARGDLTHKQLKAAYELMVLCRRFEERIAALYQQGQIGGFCHLYIGQEAILAAAKTATQDDDDFITSYRCHAHALACGVSPEQVMGELLGRENGISKGKGGSMHMFEPSKHFWGGHGIVAAQVPLGAGIALANQYQGKDTVCLTFLGDGAMNAGQTFETLNMAALWKLPVLFIIENNHYGIGTKDSRSASGELYKRGEPFGIPSVRADGMDFFAAYEAINEAVKGIRQDGGPRLLELDTYRYRGHSMSDPAKYRTREEVQNVKDTRDPIVQMREKLLASGAFKENALEKIDEETKAMLRKMEEQVLALPEPDAAELWTDIVPS